MDGTIPLGMEPSGYNVECQNGNNIAVLIISTKMYPFICLYPHLLWMAHYYRMDGCVQV